MTHAWSLTWKVAGENPGSVRDIDGAAYAEVTPSNLAARVLHGLAFCTGKNRYSPAE
jgi:hypothetical protein